MSSRSTPLNHFYGLSPIRSSDSREMDVDETNNTAMYDDAIQELAAAFPIDPQMLQITEPLAEKHLLSDIEYADFWLS